MLADKIDDDDDPSTPNITRKRAYTQLFNGSLNYLNSTGQTLCPNQEQGDAKAIFAANSALSFLSPALAWTEDEMLGTCAEIARSSCLNNGRNHSSRRCCMRAELTDRKSVCHCLCSRVERVIRPALGFANFTPAMWRGFSKWHQQATMPEGNWVTTSPTGISMEALGSYAGGYSQGCASTVPSICSCVALLAAS